MNRIIIKRKLKKICKMLLFIVLIILTVVIVFSYTTEKKLLPIIRDIASQKAKNIATLIISETIYNELEEKAVNYDDLITLEKDSSGKVSAIKTNILKINSLKTYLTMAVSKELESIGDTTIEIPIGTIINGPLLSGRGPKIKIKLIQVGSVSADVSNEFTDAGINQTRHRLMLDVFATVRVIVPLTSITEDISTGICIAETIVVGGVPEAYTKVDYAPESAVGDVMDFGASSKSNSRVIED